MNESTLIDDETSPGGKAREASQHEATLQMQLALLLKEDNTQTEGDASERKCR
jgi:hypothetical protein